MLSPGDDLQAVANASAPYTVFKLSPGLYRLQEVQPKEGQQFTGELSPQGERLAIMSGARELTEWNSGGGLWWVADQTQEQWQHGVCVDPACRFAEELFIDNERRIQVLSLGELAPGSWYFDYAADLIYIAENPAGKLVETAVANRAFFGPANNVVIRNLVVEKYANQAQHGAIDTREHNSAPLTAGAGWLIENNEVRWNHGVGIRVSNGARVLQNYVHHNGQLGVAAQGEGATFVGNEIAFNHFAGFFNDWEAGGSKFGGTTNLYVSRNYVHHNAGAGLWNDVGSRHTTYLANRVEFNDRIGIYYEISYGATIMGNLVVGNGHGYPVWGWGAGIVVAASPDVDVVDNIVIGNADGITGVQQNRGDGPYGPHIVENLNVAGNCVQHNMGWTGVLQDVGDDLVFCCRNNHFSANIYDFDEESGRFMAWDDRDIDLMEWRTFHLSDGAVGSCNADRLWPVFFDDFEIGDARFWSGAVGAN